MVRAWAEINNPKYTKIMCGISGGADSDVMLDICWKCDPQNKVEYVWFDTGLEYQATKNHLLHLEYKYDIRIKRYKALKPIPTSCKKYGQPFLSKQVSEFIRRLQRHGFRWEDESYVELLEKYPKCQAALKWWCNEWGEKSKFNIDRNKYLKEFMIANPPRFKISNLCCKYAKKDVAHTCIADNGYDLNIYGVRKSEGGARASSYKNCFSENYDGCDEYRPLFWYKNSDRKIYEEHYGITHSKCYKVYGLDRTGCAGCPFGKHFEQELEAIKTYEPKLYKAVNNIFGDSYEYTRKYRDFAKRMKKKTDK